MASTGARAYAEGWGVQWTDPLWLVRGPLEADKIFVFKTLIFNQYICWALHQIMCCLVCLFLCSGSQVYEFTVRICSVAIAVLQISISVSTQVHQLCKPNKILM